MSFEIPFIRPMFPDSALIGQDFDAIATSNWFTNFGPREREFRSAIATYLGDGGLQAVTFSSATTALLGALHAVLGRGDGVRQIVVPSFTFAAGPAAIEWAGFCPLLIDIDEDSLQPSLADARSALEQPGHTVAAILLCNTFGIGNAAIADWEELAQEHAIPLVIDSAAGFGSQYQDGNPVGTAGVCEVFSFHATKPFAIGEGGAIVTRDPALAQRLTSFQNFGFQAGAGAVTLGLNGKLQEINAAIGLRQLIGFDEAVASRRSTLLKYRDALHHVAHFPEGIERSSVCFASIVMPSRSDRDSRLEALSNGGVEARAYYAPPVHVQPHFAGLPRVSSLAVTESVVDRILSLPVHQDMAHEDVRRVISLVA